MLGVRLHGGSVVNTRSYKSKIQHVVRVAVATRTVLRYRDNERALYESVHLFAHQRPQRRRWHESGPDLDSDAWACAGFIAAMYQTRTNAMQH